MWWLTTVVPATLKAEVGGSLEPRRQRLQWAEFALLHCSLGDRERLSQKKNYISWWFQYMIIWWLMILNTFSYAYWLLFYHTLISTCWNHLLIFIAFYIFHHCIIGVLCMFWNYVSNIRTRKDITLFVYIVFWKAEFVF